jgi:hypothetical protein
VYAKAGAVIPSLYNVNINGGVYLPSFRTLLYTEKTEILSGGALVLPSIDFDSLVLSLVLL